jgi:DNA-binding transcriptional MocR family regulator
MANRGRGVNSKGRSKAEEQYFKAGYPMLKSPTFRRLSGAAVKVYMELRTRFHGANNGKLILPMEEAKQLLGLGKATVQRAFKDLEAAGFIVTTKRGQWYGREPSEYALTDKPLNGLPATNAWKNRGHKKTDPRSCSGTVVPFDGSISGPRKQQRVL